MIIGAKNEKLYPKWASWIKDLQTLGAFQYLVGLAATSDKFDCEANETGNKKLFSFRRKGQREEPYAFITNQGWLLFYFRSPALKSGIHSKERLAQDFSSFDDNPNQRCEWTIKLCSIADVKRLLAHVDLK